jgi:transcriptional regulator with XRE-family HTH domain
MSQRPPQPVAEASPETPDSEIRIGARLKLERVRRGLSLRALAERSGFSASFLSQVELDQASPSLASLGRLAQALGVSLASLVADSDTAPGASVLRASERKLLRSEWSKATVSPLLHGGTDAGTSVMLIEMDVGGRSGNPGSAPAGRELAYCIKGQVRLQLGTEEIRLNEGDCVSYEVAAGPQWTNVGRGRSQLLIVGMRST